MPPCLCVQKKKNMKVNINNEEIETAALTVADLAAERQLPEKGVAVAVNNDMVPRTEWAAHAIHEGDDILILKAFCGG